MSFNLLNYYGLDWLAMAFSFCGMWLLGKKRKISFVFTGIGTVFALCVAVLSQQYGFIVANLIMIVISIRNYVLWYQEEKRTVTNG